MDQKWTKYSYVCTSCDSLIEYTCKVKVTDITCPCGGWTVQTAESDATINNNKQQKEEAPMNTTTTFLESRVAELETAMKSHQNCDYWKSENGRIGSQLIELVNDGYDNDYDASDILNSICEIIDYNPTKTIQFEATITFTGSIDIPREEQDDFDLESVLSDAYVDINNGNVVIDNYDLYNCDEV